MTQQQLQAGFICLEQYKMIESYRNKNLLKVFVLHTTALAKKPFPEFTSIGVMNISSFPVYSSQFIQVSGCISVT